MPHVKGRCCRFLAAGKRVAVNSSLRRFACPALRRLSCAVAGLAPLCIEPSLSNKNR